MSEYNGESRAITVGGKDLGACEVVPKKGFFGNLVDKVRLASKSDLDKSAVEKGITTLDDKLTYQGQELFNDYQYRKNKEDFFADAGVAALLAEKDNDDK